MPGVFWYRRLPKHTEQEAEAAEGLLLHFCLDLDAELYKRVLGDHALGNQKWPDLPGKSLNLACKTGVHFRPK